MHDAGDQFLAGPRFALQQQVHAAAGHRNDPLAKLLHARGFADQFLHRPRVDHLCPHS